MGKFFHTPATIPMRCGQLCAGPQENTLNPFNGKAFGCLHDFPPGQGLTDPDGLWAGHRPFLMLPT
jgi:hypothetical protein